TPLAPLKRGNKKFFIIDLLVSSNIPNPNFTLQTSYFPTSYHLAFPFSLITFPFSLKKTLLII
ncbi:MAG: hypothetical protein ACI8YO_002838, partial [Gammaproteobacteria bacterium]